MIFDRWILHSFPIYRPLNVTFLLRQMFINLFYMVHCYNTVSPCMLEATINRTCSLQKNTRVKDSRLHHLEVIPEDKIGSDS